MIIYTSTAHIFYFRHIHVKQQQVLQMVKHVMYIKLAVLHSFSSRMHLPLIKLPLPRSNNKFVHKTLHQHFLGNIWRLDTEDKFAKPSFNGRKHNLILPSLTINHCLFLWTFSASYNCFFPSQISLSLAPALYPTLITGFIPRLSR